MSKIGLKYLIPFLTLYDIQMLSDGRGGTGDLNFFDEFLGLTPKEPTFIYVYPGPALQHYTHPN